MELDLASATLAVGALGTAATGLVDTIKVFGPSVTSRVGFGSMKKTTRRLPPGDTETKNDGLVRADIIDMLLANWINGMDSAVPVAAATSFVKLQLNDQSAENLALARLARKLKQAGTPESALTTDERDTFGSFDLSVAAFVEKA